MNMDTRRAALLKIASTLDGITWMTDDDRIQHAIASSLLLIAISLSEIEGLVTNVSSSGRSADEGEVTDG